MSPLELFDHKPERVSHELYRLQHFCNEVDFEALQPDEDESVEIRQIRHVLFDYVRFWSLDTIWFRGKPVGILQRAGRDGRDHNKRFIVDLPLYQEMVLYLHSLPKDPTWIDDEDVVGMDADIDVSTFYGYSLGEP